MPPGLIALVGSGEFLPGMEDVDRELLAGRPPRAVFLPTAAAPEGSDTVRYWTDLGAEHYTRLGVEPVPLLVLSRADADRPALASAIAGAGLVYLSGGNPGYLAETLRHTAVWAAIVAAWRAGASVAGCSAGAGALTRVVYDVRQRDRGALPGLGLVNHVSVIPHFDRMQAWAPGIVERFLHDTPRDVHLVGIDEDTAVVGGGDEWRVRGRQRAWLLGRGGSRQGFEAPSEIPLPRPLPAPRP